MSKSEAWVAPFAFHPQNGTKHPKNSSVSDLAYGQHVVEDFFFNYFWVAKYKKRISLVKLLLHVERLPCKEKLCKYFMYL